MATVPIRLTLNAVGVKQGERDVTAAFNKIKTGAKETGSAVDRLGRQSINPMTRMGQAVDRVGGKSKNLGLVINNMSNQIGDFAVQVSMGTSAIRALGMQAPQAAGALAMLGGPFTAIATGIGLVAALGLPLIGLLLNMGGEAETLADKLEAVSDRVSGAKDAMELAKRPVSELSNEYGIFAEMVRDATDAQAEFDLYHAMAQIRELKGELAEGVFEIPDMFDFLEIMPSVSQAFKDAGREADAFTERQLASLAHNLGITAAEALPVLDAFAALEAASSDSEIATATTQLAEAMFKLRPTTDEATTKVGELANAAKTAGENAASILTALTDIVNLGPISITVGMTGAGGVGRGRVMPTEADLMMMRMGGEYIESEAERKRRLGIRTGGKSAIEKERDELKRFADGIKPVLTLLQEYEQNMTKLNRAKEIGAITSEQFAQKEALLTEQFQYASGAMIDYTSVANTFANSLENSLMAMVDGTMSVQDAFKSMATAVIKELFRVMVVQQMVNSIMGAFGYSRATTGNFIKSFDGGGYTGAGPRSGGLDGKGGFMAMLHPNETVVDHTKGQSGGGSVVVNQTINVSAGVAQTVRAEMQNMLPAFKQQATQGVLDAKRRGGAYGGSFA